MPHKKKKPVQKFIEVGDVLNPGWICWEKKKISQKKKNPRGDQGGDLFLGKKKGAASKHLGGCPEQKSPKGKRRGTQ